MSNQPNTAAGDIAYWGLTRAQAAHYYARLSRMHADTSTRFAELAAHYARRSVLAGRIGMVFAGVSIVLALVVLAVGP